MASVWCDFDLLPNRGLVLMLTGFFLFPSFFFITLHAGAEVARNMDTLLFVVLA